MTKWRGEEVAREMATNARRAYSKPATTRPQRRGRQRPGSTGPLRGRRRAGLPAGAAARRGGPRGQRTLCVRLVWDKRYIALGPVAAVVGLAFRAYDPEHLLGGAEGLGITCALIPTRHAGVNIGRRHMPLNAVFQNGPNWGKDVFIPIDWVIGGKAQVGNGWRMLMESLAAGRGISLPSSSPGMAKLAVRATGPFARGRAGVAAVRMVSVDIHPPMVRRSERRCSCCCARSATLRYPGPRRTRE